ncbi:MAG TPA: DUF192 domain-containing protein [Candidatus Binatia bacterium]|jgi:hypothetical protein
MPIINLDKNTWLATKVRKADSFLTRLVGLIKRNKLGPEEALWLIPSKGVHTVGMKFPIDVIFLDKNYKVVDVVPAMVPYRATKIHLTAYSALELPKGAIGKSRTEPGDRLDISQAESSAVDDLRETQLNEVG